MTKGCASCAVTMLRGHVYLVSQSEQVRGRNDALQYKRKHKETFFSTISQARYACI